MLDSNDLQNGFTLQRSTVKTAEEHLRSRRAGVRVLETVLGKRGWC